MFRHRKQQRMNLLFDDSFMSTGDVDEFYQFHNKVNANVSGLSILLLLGLHYLIRPLLSSAQKAPKPKAPSQRVVRSLNLPKQKTPSLKVRSPRAQRRSQRRCVYLDSYVLVHMIAPVNLRRRYYLRLDVKQLRLKLQPAILPHHLRPSPQQQQKIQLIIRPLSI